MLIVKIKLHSAITGKVTTLATDKIVNTGTSTPANGGEKLLKISRANCCARGAYSIAP